MPEPISTLLSVASTLWVSGNLGKRYFWDKPQRNLTLELVQAETSAFNNLKKGLDKIQNGLEGEKLAKCLGDLRELLDALVPRSRASFHTSSSGWNPESVEMLLEFCDERSHFVDDGIATQLKLPLPKVDLTPPQLVDAIRDLHGYGREIPRNFLCVARDSRVSFDLMCRWLAHYFEEKISEVYAKERGESRWRRFSRRLDWEVGSKDILKVCQAEIREVYSTLCYLEATPRRIAHYVQRGYDLKIQAAAKALNAEAGRVFDAAIKDIKSASEAFYTALHGRWRVAIFSSLSVPILGRKVRAEIPRWKKMIKAIREFGDGAKKIWTPTEVMAQEIEKIWDEMAGETVKSLVMQVAKELNTLRNDVLKLEDEQLQILNDIVKAFESNKAVDQIGLDVATFTSLKTVLLQVSKKAKLRQDLGNVRRRNPAVRSQRSPLNVPIEPPGMVRIPAGKFRMGTSLELYSEKLLRDVACRGGKCLPPTA